MSWTARRPILPGHDLCNMQVDCVFLIIQCVCCRRCLTPTTHHTVDFETIHIRKCYTRCVWLKLWISSNDTQLCFELQVERLLQTMTLKFLDSESKRTDILDAETPTSAHDSIGAAAGLLSLLVSVALNISTAQLATLDSSADTNVERPKKDNITGCVVQQLDFGIVILVITCCIDRQLCGSVSKHMDLELYVIDREHIDTAVLNHCTP